MKAEKGKLQKNRESNMENDDVEMLGSDSNEAVCNAFIPFAFAFHLCINFRFNQHCFTHQCRLHCRAWSWMAWRSAWRKWKTKLLLCGRCRPRSRRKWDLFKVPSFVNYLFCYFFKKKLNIQLFYVICEIICIWYKLGWIGCVLCEN